MAWKECSVMYEKLQFAARRRADGRAVQRVRHLAQTGYKIFDHQECGVQGLTDRSRRPYLYPRFGELRVDAISRDSVKD